MLRCWLKLPGRLHQLCSASWAPSHAGLCESSFYSILHSWMDNDTAVFLCEVHTRCEEHAGPAQASEHHVAYLQQGCAAYSGGCYSVLQWASLFLWLTIGKRFGARAAQLLSGAGMPSRVLLHLAFTETFWQLLYAKLLSGSCGDVRFTRMGKGVGRAPRRTPHLPGGNVLTNRCQCCLAVE
jgi:hypothetical protein